MSWSKVWVIRLTAIQPTRTFVSAKRPRQLNGLHPLVRPLKDISKNISSSISQIAITSIIIENPLTVRPFQAFFPLLSKKKEFKELKAQRGSKSLKFLQTLIFLRITKPYRGSSELKSAYRGSFSSNGSQGLTQALKELTRKSM